MNIIGFFFFKYMLNMMPAMCIKQVGTGATQGWKSCEMLRKHLFEDSTGKQVY